MINNLNHYKDYFYGFMVPSTGYLRYSDIVTYDDGFVLLFPNENTREVAEFAPSGKLFHTLKASREWGRMLEIGTIGALNDAIAEGRMQEIILTQEALFEERIGHLADTIVKSGGKKFIFFKNGINTKPNITAVIKPTINDKTTFVNNNIFFTHSLIISKTIILQVLR